MRRPCIYPLDLLVRYGVFGVIAASISSCSLSSMAEVLTAKAIKVLDAFLAAVWNLTCVPSTREHVTMNVTHSLVM